jgi:hypothetical protein
MKKGLAVFALVATGVAAHAQTVIDDFTASMPDYVLPTQAPYGSNGTGISGSLFNFRTGNAASYGGNGTDLFVVSAPGNGAITATGNGTASGLLNLAYSDGGATSLSGYQSITLHVSNVTAPMSAAFGLYSNGYNNYSYGGFNISGTGDITLDLNSTIGDTLYKGSVDSLFFNISVGAGQSISISKVTANAVPEPASLAAMGLGLTFLARRKKKAA